MKLVVTGATGRLGQVFVSQALVKGHEITAIVRNVEKAKEVLPKKVKLVQASLTQENLVELERACVARDILVHLAAEIRFDQKTFDDNVQATRVVVDAAKKTGIKRIVYMSSTALYHKPPLLPIDESQTPTPVDFYGRSKLEGEKIVEQSKIPFVFIRAPAIYGPGFTEGFKTVVVLLKKGVMPVIGSGENRIPLVHVNDVAQALVLGLTTKNVNNAFIVSNDALTQNQALELVAKFAQVKTPSIKIPVTLAVFIAFLTSFFKKSVKPEYVSFLAEDRCFDTRKARKMLGWKETVNLEDGVKESVEEVLQSTS